MGSHPASFSAPRIVVVSVIFFPMGLFYYPSALGPADEPLTIEWPEGHSYAVVATTFHGGAVLGTTATEDEAWAIYDQWPETNCRCGCRGIVTRDGFHLRRGGSPQKIIDD